MFKFADRKKKNHLVLIPGWAFDYRIFAALDLPYNYFFFCDESTVNFEDELKKILARDNIEKISLLGWSQGTFRACDFACKNPDTIEEIILVSLRKKYEKEGLENIKKYLIRNRKAYLYKFYRECFCENEKDCYRWFRDTFLMDYLDKMSLDRLIRNLDRLWRVEIRPESLKKLKRIKLVHGRADTIAPVSQAIDIANFLPQSQLITFEQTGHLPFLREDFKRRLYE